MKRCVENLKVALIESIDGVRAEKIQDVADDVANKGLRRDQAKSTDADSRTLIREFGAFSFEFSANPNIPKVSVFYSHSKLNIGK